MLELPFHRPITRFYTERLVLPRLPKRSSENSMLTASSQFGPEGNTGSWTRRALLLMGSGWSSEEEALEDEEPDEAGLEPAVPSAGAGRTEHEQEKGREGEQRAVRRHRCTPKCLPLGGLGERLPRNRPTA